MRRLKVAVPFEVRRSGMVSRMLRLVRVDSVVYRTISQRCFDPDARIPDGPRGIPVARVRRNTRGT